VARSADSGLLRYFLRRLAVMLGLLVLVSVLIFAMVEILPGDVGNLILGQYATAENVDLVRQQLGLDRPLAVRYLDWMGGFLTGDWGDSWRLGTPLAPLIGRRLYNSVVLAGVAFAFVIPVSITAGIVSALRRDRLTDRVINGISVVSITIPEFVSSMFLILFFSLLLPWFPSSAMVPEDAGPLTTLRYLALPVIAISPVLIGYIARTVRASMITELGADYTRTAYLKGLDPRTVITKHVLRNALLPAITVIANQIAWLVGGLVVIEAVFNYPGIGQLLLQAALVQDVPMLEAIVLILAAILMLSNLAADLLYTMLNPRVRAQATGGAT
jgi:peptide/nickel transport system permease protein